MTDPDRDDVDDVDSDDVVDEVDGDAVEKDPAKPADGSVGSVIARMRGDRVMTALAVVAVIAVVAAVVFGVLWGQRGSELDDQHRAQQDRETAESIAGRYAVGAAQFDFKDLNPWAKALKNGTADSLDARFDVAVKTLTPLLQELQWVQSATLMAAKTTEIRSGRHYVVDVFVSTRMTSTQNPEGMTTVTPYSLTLDRDDDWLITDVAGIAGSVEGDGAVPGVGGPAAGEPTAGDPTTGKAPD